MRVPVFEAYRAKHALFLFPGLTQNGFFIKFVAYLTKACLSKRRRFIVKQQRYGVFALTRQTKFPQTSTRLGYRPKSALIPT